MRFLVLLITLSKILRSNVLLLFLLARPQLVEQWHSVEALGPLDILRPIPQVLHAHLLTPSTIYPLVAPGAPVSFSHTPYITHTHVHTYTLLKLIN